METFIRLFFFCVIINSAYINGDLLGQQAEVSSDNPENIFLSQHGNIKIIELIKEARYSIFIVSYALTNSHIADAIISASGRGVDVSLILDADQYNNNRFSFGGVLKKSKIKIRLIDSDNWRLISDFGVIDENIIYVGGALLHTEMEKNPKLGSFLIFRENEYVTSQYIRTFLRISNSGFTMHSKF